MSEKVIGPFALNLVHHGDALECLRRLPDECVQVCVTSPPYWGLRDYGTGKWEGGDPSCDHSKSTSDKSGPDSPFSRSNNVNHSSEGWIGKICGKCGARKIDNQFGLEPTPQEYVEKMVAVFEEVRRVLRKDGTLWLNMGDSYAGNCGAQGRQGKSEELAGRSACAERQIAAAAKKEHNTGSTKNLGGLKPKDLCGIPWRLAFALQTAGWYLRCDIIWSKPNPMPESVKDRPTKSHEYLFLLAKSERYYYDAAAIRERISDASIKRISEPSFQQQTGGEKDYSHGTNQSRSARRAVENFSKKVKKPTGWATGKDHSTMNWAKEKGYGEVKEGNAPDRYSDLDIETMKNMGRNKRSVWEIATYPCPEAHFATFPPALVEPCILAGSRSGDVVLDPFSGSGTTGDIALRHGRKFIGFDLNEKYCRELAAPRLAAAERGQTLEQYQSGQMILFDQETAQ